MFGEFKFERMNETDVRENIVSPLLKELQYRHSTPNDVITEQTLRYPKSFIGSKKRKTLNFGERRITFLKSMVVSGG